MELTKQKLIKEYDDIDSFIKELEEKKRRLRARILEEFEEGSTEMDGWTVNITKVAGRVTLDTKRLKSELPNVYEEFSSTGEPSYRISVKACA